MPSKRQPKALVEREAYASKGACNVGFRPPLSAGLLRLPLTAQQGRIQTSIDKALITRMQSFGWQQKTIQSRVPSTRLMC